MMTIWIEIFLVLFLIGLNGFFAMAELAVLSARRSQLKERAEAGSDAAKTVLEFRDDSGRFLASIQFGITLVGILAGVFSGATLTREFARLLAGWPMLAPYSQALALILMVLTISFLSVVFGELVPKQIALRHPLETAQRIAIPIRWINRLSFPLVHLLSQSTEAVLRLLNLTPTSAPPISEEEIILLLQEGHQAGTFAVEAQQLIERVFDMSHARLAEHMTPRRHLIALDLFASSEVWKAQILASQKSSYPVYSGNPDKIEGVVFLKELLPHLVYGQTLAEVCGVAKRH